MNRPLLFRKRLIPMEIVPLNGDRLLYMDSHMIITSWETLKPKIELSHGYSLYLMEQGFKISRFYNHRDQLMYWYCDLIETEYQEPENTYVFTDLLADVIVLPDGSNQILDLDELSQAYLDGLLTKEQLCRALDCLHRLLQTIYAGTFETIAAPLLEWENKERKNTPFCCEN